MEDQVMVDEITADEVTEDQTITVVPEVCDYDADDNSSSSCNAGTIAAAVAGGAALGVITVKAAKWGFGKAKSGITKLKAKIDEHKQAKEGKSIEVEAEVVENPRAYKYPEKK